MYQAEYTYKKSSEVLDAIAQINSFGVFDHIILIGIISLVLFLIFYFIPIIFVVLDTIKENKLKEKKRFLLDQIIMQKEIETDIEKELKEEEEKKIHKNKDA